MSRQRRSVKAVAERVRLPCDIRVPKTRADEYGIRMGQVAARHLSLSSFVFAKHARALEGGAQRIAISLGGPGFGEIVDEFVAPVK